MIKKRFEELERPAVRREQKKVLPYTVKEIGDEAALLKWRQTQFVKETEYQMKKALTQQAIIANLQAAMDSGQAERERQELWETLRGVEYKEPTFGKYYKKAISVIQKTYTTSWYKRLLDSAINWFTSINFGN